MKKNNRKAKKVEEKPASPDSGQKTVLIIDDDEGILKAVSILLSSEGYRVMTSPDERYIEELCAGSLLPDVIVLDVLLSGVDGRDICRKLKQTEKSRRIPIIMFSAYPTAEKTAKAAGADAFLSKPFNIDDMLAKVARLSSRAH